MLRFVGFPDVCSAVLGQKRSYAPVAVIAVVRRKQSGPYALPGRARHNGYGANEKCHRTQKGRDLVTILKMPGFMGISVQADA